MAIQPSMQKRLEVRERPQDRWTIMYQKWRDLLFLHWQFDIAEIQRTLPSGLYVDTFEERAYVGLLPFYMNGVRPRFCPPIPGISYFLETNLRTYVYNEQGTPGIWFYSLDANQWLATKLAKWFFNLPYIYSRMRAERSSNNEIYYRVQRYGTSEINRFQYRPTSSTIQAQPGTLEFFLVERYLLFTAIRDKLYTGQVHHTPYPICDVEVKDYSAGLLPLSGLARPKSAPDHLLMSPGVDVEIFYPQRVK